MTESKRSHDGTRENRLASRKTSEAEESSEKTYEIRLGVTQLIAVFAISALLVLGIYSYAQAYQAPLRPVAQIGRPITIQSVTFQDIDGNPRVPAVFARGEKVVVSVTISYPSDTYYGTTLTFLQVAEIWEPPPPPPPVITHGPFAFMGFFFGSINLGQQLTSGVGWAIPVEAPTGEYSVDVFVWNKWGPPDWYTYADPWTATFTVT